jgi:hypothetical protein
MELELLHQMDTRRYRCHIIYDVKHDGWHKARLVAGGHPTDPNTESVYSGVVSNTHNFKLKGAGPLTYHLVCDYFRDKDGTLCYGLCKYIAKILDQFENMFGCIPMEYTSPLEKGDHSELDNTEELDEDGTKRYQTMIGYLQWAVSLGIFDIQTSTMTISCFRAAPRIKHLNRLKRIYGYLKKFASAAIQVRLLEPDLGELPDQDFDWWHSVYGHVTATKGCT